jgi:hypothetical protein
MSPALHCGIAIFRGITQSFHGGMSWDKEGYPLSTDKGYASNRMLFINGGSEMVFESPDDIMLFVNRMVSPLKHPRELRNMAR